MNTKFKTSITVRIDDHVYEEIQEMIWIERKKQSEILREIVLLGLEAKKERQG